MKFFKIILLLMLFSCDSNQNQNQNFEEISFRINNQLITESFAFDKNSFKIKFPKNVDFLSDTLYNKIKINIDNDTSGIFNINLLTALQSDTGFSILLSKVISQLNIFNYLNDEYLNSLKNIFNSKEIHISKYLHNNIKFKQYTIVTNDLVLVKIYFLINNNFYQLDYVVPKKLYKDFLIYIESSIGSIFN